MKKKDKRRRGYAVLLAVVLLISACGTTKEEEGHMKGLFVNAPDAWVGDVMGLSDEKGIYLNYLYETDENGIAYHPIHRFYTKDFCSYEDRGEVLSFGEELEAPDLAIGTGSFFQSKDGKYHCFYTGHNDRAPELGIDKECIMHAISEDNEIWEKLPEDTFYAPENYSSDDFRDPFILWNEEENCYWMLLGAREKSQNGGSIVKYKSTDLSNWTFDGPFFEQEELYYMECPDLFQINDWYYLVFSWNNVTYYRMSKNINGPWIKPEYDTFDGHAFYAAKTVEYQGIRYLVGFIDRKKGEDDSLDYTWAGSICPYQLVQKENGELGVKMPDTYGTQYFTEQIHLSNKKEKLHFSGEKEPVFYGKLPQSMMFSCKMTVKETGEGAKTGFLFGEENGSRSGYPVYMDFEQNMLCYDGYVEDEKYPILNENQQGFSFETGKKYNIKLVVENEVVILYVNEEKVLSNRIYGAINKQWGIFAENADVIYEQIEISTTDEN